MRKRPLPWDASPPGADHDTQLRLVVEVVDFERADNVIEGSAYGGGELREQAGQAGDILDELTRVVRVVPTRTDNLSGTGLRRPESVERIGRCGTSCDQVGKRIGSCPRRDQKLARGEHGRRIGTPRPEP